MYSWAAQIFWGLNFQWLSLRLAQFPNVYQFRGSQVNVLPPVQKLEDALLKPFLDVSTGRIRASREVVKRRSRDPKLGLHSGFGPISRLAIGN